MENQKFRRFFLYFLDNIFPFFLSLGFLFFIFQVISDRGFFEYLGIDFRVWWSTSHVIHEYGIDQIYGLDLLKNFQQNLYFTYAKQGETYIPFLTLPFAYPPVFALPLTWVRSFKDPVLCFIFWLSAYFFLYLIYFKRLYVIFLGFLEKWKLILKLI